MARTNSSKWTALLDPRGWGQLFEGFWYQWLGTRSRRDLLLFGGPAVLLFCAASYFAYDGFRNQGKRDASYRQKLADALQERDYERAGWMAHRLDADEVSTKRVDQARAAASFERFVEESTTVAPVVTLERMRTLAPNHTFGLAAAHYWVASHYIEDSASAPSISLEELIHHLEGATQEFGLEPQLNRWLASAYIAADRQQQAKERLAIVADQDVEAWLELCQLEIASGNVSVGQRMLNQGLLALDETLATSNDDQLRRTMIDALAMRADYPTALEHCERLVSASDEERSELRAKLYVAWIHDRHNGVASKNEVSLRELIDEAIQSCGSQPSLWAECTQCLISTGQPVERWPYVLQKAIADGSLPIDVLNSLAIRYLGEGRADKAIETWRKALKAEPGSSFIANNLATVLLDSDADDSKQEIGELVALAEKDLGNDPSFVETRGRWFAVTGNFERAVEDLEYALANQSGNLQSHRALYDCYCSLGNCELAEMHLRIAESLSNGADKGTAP